MNTATIALFCCLYEFGLVCEEWEEHRIVTSTPKRIRYSRRKPGARMITMALFHLSPYLNVNTVLVPRHRRNVPGLLL